MLTISKRARIVCGSLAQIYRGPPGHRFAVIGGPLDESLNPRKFALPLFRQLQVKKVFQFGRSLNPWNPDLCGLRPRTAVEDGLVLPRKLRT